MNHPKSWHDERRKGWGGSDATILMTGTEAQRLELNHIKRGLIEGTDLSHILAVQIGIETEELNRTWFENNSGEIVSTTNTEGLVHVDKDYMRANLDGRCCSSIFEAKYHGGNKTIEELGEHYYWQMQHYMYVTYTTKCYLSVIFGHYSRYEYMEIPRDQDSIDMWLIVAEKEWENVKSDRDPSNHIPQKVKINIDDMRELDVTGQNFESDWRELAQSWIANKQPAKDFKAAVSEIKAMVPDDVRRLYGHGIQAKRSKNGAITIKEIK